MGVIVSRYDGRRADSAYVCSKRVGPDSGGSRNNSALAGLIATAFVGMESFRTYHDVLGSIFAGVFGAMIFVLIWLRDDSPWHRRVKVTFAVMLLPAVVYSFMQLLSTLLVWEMVLGFAGGKRWEVPIAAHVSGIVSGMGAFVITYNTMGSTKIWGRRVSYGGVVKVGVLIFVLLLVCLVVYLANSSYLGELSLGAVAGVVSVQVGASVSLVVFLCT